MSGPAQKRYIRRVAILTALFLAAFALITVIQSDAAEPGWLALAIAILPGLAVIGVFWAIGRLIVEESDEFVRMLTIRQVLVASGLALSAASVWGFLEAASLVAHVDAYWYAVIWFGGLIVGSIINRVQHGAWGAA